METEERDVATDAKEMGMLEIDAGTELGSKPNEEEVVVRIVVGEGTGVLVVTTVGGDCASADDEHSS